MHLSWQRLSLPTVNLWATSRGGSRETRVVVLTLVDGALRGLGEASPISRYGESVESVEAFVGALDPARLSFHDLTASMEYVQSAQVGQYAAKSAISMALYDGASRAAGQPLGTFLGLPFTEQRHLTSFSIGIASADETHSKVRDAADYPVLKLKLGGPDDAAAFAAARSAAPEKTLRVDANEAWHSKELALERIEWLAKDGKVELVEQPMPAATPHADLAWLRARSPLPLVADESFRSRDDVSLCVDCFHGVNAKLSKTSGISSTMDALVHARSQGLRTMLGCMVETSIAISAAAHLAELCDYLDLDGNLLLARDPYQGVRCERGVLSFAGVSESTGLRVVER